MQCNRTKFISTAQGSSLTLCSVEVKLKIIYAASLFHCVIKEAWILDTTHPHVSLHSITARPHPLYHIHRITESQDSVISAFPIISGLEEVARLDGKDEATQEWCDAGGTPHSSPKYLWPWDPVRTLCKGRCFSPALHAKESCSRCLTARLTETNPTLIFPAPWHQIRANFSSAVL